MTDTAPNPIATLVAELRDDAEGFEQSLSWRAAEMLEALSDQYDELDLIFDAQAQAVPKIVAELNQARALVGVAQERWAVRMRLTTDGSTFYESMASKEAADRFIANPPMWHTPGYSTDLVVVTRTTAETEWKAAS